MICLRQSSSATITLGPFVDSVDAVTPETALTVTVKVAKNGAALAARSDVTAIAHDADGYYPVVLNATDTSAVGRLRVAATATGALPVWEDFTVLAANVYDVLFGTVAPSTHTAAAVQALVAAGAVASVTGNVGGNVVGSVASVTAPVTAGTVSDKTGYALAVAPPTAAVIAAEVWDTAPAGTPVEEIAAAVWDAAPTGTPVATIAAAVRDVNNTAPAANSLGEAINDAGGGGGGGATASEVWAHATAVSLTTRVALLPTAWPANLSSLAIDAAGNVNANVEEWRGSAPNALVSGQVDAAATTTLGATAPAGWINTAAFASGATLPRVTLADAVTTLTGHTPQTGDAYARIGAAGAGLTSLAPAATALLRATWTDAKAAFLDAAVTSRMATFSYTAPDNATIAAIAAKTTNLPVDPASQTAVAAIHNSTDVVAVVPTQIQRPASGSVTYRIELYLYNDDDSMMDPDSAPTITLVNNAGVSRAARLDSTTMASVSTGRYRAIYTADAADPVEQLSWNFTVVEAAVTKVYGATTLAVDTIAVDFDTVSSAKLDDLHDRLTVGRATNLDNLDVASSLIKAKTDLIPASPAAVGSNMGTVASVTAPVTAGTVNDKSGYLLGAAALDAISTTLNGAPATFREKLLWGVQRQWDTRQDLVTEEIVTIGTDGVTEITVQPYTSTTTEKTVGSPT